MTSTSSRLLLAAGLLCGSLVLTAPATAAAQVPIGYAVGIGAVIPVGSGVSDRLGAGVHVDGGIYYKFMSMLSAGLHITYDLPFGQRDKDFNFDHEASFVGINARLMYMGDIGTLFEYWASLGVGLYFNKMSTCDGGCKVENASQGGMDVSLGFGFKVWGPLSLGPAVGASFPSFANFADWTILHASLRLHWDL